MTSSKTINIIFSKDGKNFDSSELGSSTAIHCVDYFFTSVSTLINYFGSWIWKILIGAYNALFLNNQFFKK